MEWFPGDTVKWQKQNNIYNTHSCEIKGEIRKHTSPCLSLPIKEDKPENN